MKNGILFYNWESVESFFEALARMKSSYVVLRNYENMHLPGFFTKDHEDIDILCSDREEFIATSKALPKMEVTDKIHLMIFIAGKGVPIDLRTVGDDYYDCKWQQKMLINRRVADNGNWYVMNSEDYYYSLAYHSIIQKKYLTDEYRERLNVMASDLKIIGGGEQEHLNNIECFFKDNSYEFTRAKDKSVPFRYKNENSTSINVDKKSVKDSVRDFAKSIGVYNLISDLYNIKNRKTVESHKEEKEKLLEDIIENPYDYCSKMSSETIYYPAIKGIENLSLEDRACIRSFEKVFGQVVLITEENLKEYIKNKAIYEEITEGYKEKKIPEDIFCKIIGLMIVGINGGFWIEKGMYLLNENKNSVKIKTEDVVDKKYINEALRIIFEYRYINKSIVNRAFEKEMTKNIRVNRDFFPVNSDCIYNEKEWQNVKEKYDVIFLGDKKGWSDINTYYCQICRGNI